MSSITQELDEQELDEICRGAEEKDVEGQHR